MDVALLNVQITFQKNTVVVDAIGNHKNSWEDYYTCHATVSGESMTGSSEKSVAGTTVDDADLSFTVRWCKTASAISSTGYRVLFDGEIYDILSVDHMGYKRKALKFKCRKARR